MSHSPRPEYDTTLAFRRIADEYEIALEGPDSTVCGDTLTGDRSRSRSRLKVEGEAFVRPDGGVAVKVRFRAPIGDEH